MFRIVEALVDRDVSRVTELARELDLAKSTAHQQLSMLHSLGYGVKEREECHVRLCFLRIGHPVPERDLATC